MYVVFTFILVLTYLILSLLHSLHTSSPGSIIVDVKIAVDINANMSQIEEILRTALQNNLLINGAEFYKAIVGGNAVQNCYRMYDKYDPLCGLHLRLNAINVRDTWVSPTIKYVNMLHVPIFTRRVNFNLVQCLRIDTNMYTFCIRRILLYKIHMRFLCNICFRILIILQMGTPL